VIIATAIGTSHSISDPPSPNRLGIVAVNLGVLYSFTLTFANGIAMEILFTVGETKPDGLDMACKADGTPALEGFILFFATGLAYKTHQYTPIRSLDR